MIEMVLAGVQASGGLSLCDARQPPGKERPHILSKEPGSPGGQAMLWGLTDPVQHKSTDMGDDALKNESSE